MWYFYWSIQPKINCQKVGSPKKYIKHYSVHHLVCPYQMQGFGDSGSRIFLTDGKEATDSLFPCSPLIDLDGKKQETILWIFFNFFLGFWLYLRLFVGNFHFLGKRFCLVKDILPILLNSQYALTKMHHDVHVLSFQFNFILLIKRQIQKTGLSIVRRGISFNMPT